MRRPRNAIKRVDRFPGNSDIDLEFAAGDLIATVIGLGPRVFLTLDWIDPKTKDAASLADGGQSPSEGPYTGL